MTRAAIPKSEATRARILDVALGVFRERGFAQATMREIAAAAGVAVGAAYYYFDSKDALVMAFYQQAQDEMATEVERILSSARNFEERLRGLIGHKFAHFGPNRALMGALSAHVDPRHPLSPFSRETAPIRDRDIAYFARAIADSKIKLAPTIQPYFPRLLWLYQMGLMLFWVCDDSPSQARTQLLFDRTLQMLLFTLKLASLPLLRPLYRPAGELLRSIYGEP
ncbi:MAG TPA: TetR family transcriptional regulator [Terracidiphilus sp.]|jgi:AcrR family transcriptional regulator|nr:TetR family transcriptional regulator [Terracidiphilus sp.]